MLERTIVALLFFIFTLAGPTLTDLLRFVIGEPARKLVDLVKVPT